MTKFRSYLREAKINESAILLQYHEEYNPKLFDNNRLIPEVRTKLLQDAEAFRVFTEIFPLDSITDTVGTW